MKRGTKIVLWSLAFFGPIWWIYPVGLLGGAKATLSPETTRITSPLKADGTPDYAAWHNTRDGAGVTEDNNAAVLLIACWKEQEDLYDRLKVRPRPVAGAVRQWFEEWAEASKVSLREPALREAQDLSKVALEVDMEGYYPWTGEAHPDLAAWLRSQQPFAERIVEASRRGRLFVPYAEGAELFNASTAWMSQVRVDAQLLRLRAMQCAGEGRMAEALEDVRAMRRLARLVAVSQSSMMAPSISGRMEQEADEALAQIALICPKGHPSRPELAQLAGEPTLDFEAMIVRMLRESARDDALEMAQTFFQQKMFRQEPFLGRLMLRVLKDQVDMDQALRRIHARFEGAVLHRPLPKTRTMSTKDAVCLPILLPPGLRGRMLTAPIVTAAEAWVPSRTLLDLSAEDHKALHAFVPVAAALGAWRADHGGIYPATLEALVPDYLPGLPKLETGRGTWVYETADAGKAFGVIRVKDDEKDLYAKRPLSCLVVFGSPGFDKAREHSAEE